ncbi:MAG: PAS domain-containing protein [Candidatus Pacebacteria bacterium]|nr:PAS domain-containing protein [Candidatus Paceibacterota bacterium]
MINNGAKGEDRRLGNAEEKLYQSEAMYRRLMENVNDIVYSMDAEGTLTHISPQVRRYGLLPEKLAGHHFSELVYPEDREAVTADFRKTLESGEEFPTQFRITSADGTIRWFQELGHVQRDRSGNIVDITGVLRDVTEQVETEKKLAESEQRYRTLVEHIPALIYTAELDDQSTTIYISPQVQDIMGLSAKDYEKDPGLWHRRIHPEDKSRVMAALRKTQQSGAAFSEEYRFLDNDGTYRWMRDDAAVIRDLQGHPTCLQGVMQDISEWKETERQLRKSQAALAEAQRIAHLGSWEWDLTNDVVVWSDETFRIFGLDPSAVTPSLDAYKNVVHPADLNKVMEEIETSRDHHRPYDVEHRVVHPDGSERYVWEQGCWHYDKDNRPIRMVGTAFDITQRKNAEMALNEEKRQLRELSGKFAMAEERERRRIATGLHDHVGQILVASQLGLNHVTRLEDLGQAKHELKELEGLVSKAITATRTLTFELSSSVLYELGIEAAIADLCEQISTQYRLPVTYHGGETSYPANSDLDIILFRATSELLFNVVKHAKADSASVAINVNADDIVITVEDDGVGFDTASTQNGITPTGGFGLFEIQERLSYIGGSLDIQSCKGKGTQVRLRAPLNIRKH